MNYPYTPPFFLENQSVDEIHDRMLSSLPKGIDKSEGGITWDFTRPAALLKAEFAGFELNETIKLIFPQWSYGEWLDLHAQKVNVTRRTANKSTGFVSVTGTLGTKIPLGFQFATPSNLSSSVIFETTKETVLTGTLDEKGKVSAEIPIQAVSGGVLGNVPEDTIKLMVTPLSGISYITNPLPITGGAEIENDDSLIERVLDAMRFGSSFVGNNSDYIRWAKEVSGVGEVIVIPCSFGAGTVELIIVDSSGNPANEQIKQDVYLHIMGNGDNDISRKAPIGAQLLVSSPEKLVINILATIVLEDAEDLQTVSDRFIKNLVEYWLVVANEVSENADNIGYIRIVQVGAILAKTAGVKDYCGLEINGSQENVPISNREFPVTGEVILNAGA